MSPLHYFLELFETNHFTLHLLLAFLGISSLKYFNIKLPQIRSRIVVLTVIIFLGMALRLAWIAFSSHTPQFGWDSLLSENNIINAHALDISKGIWFVGPDGVPLASRPIGYPIFLGFVYKLFGASVEVIRATNLALYAGTTVLIYLMAKRLFSERVALVAAFIYSIFPTSVYSVVLVTDEQFFLPIWYLGLYLLIRHTSESERFSPGKLFIYGLIFGYATMTRTNVIFMPVVVAIAYLTMRYSWKRVAVSFLIVFIAMQLINLPWVIRNYKIWGVPLLYTDNAHYLYDNMNAWTTPEDGGHIPEKGEPGYSAELDEAFKSGNIALRNNLSGREMMRYVVTHPHKVLPLGISRVLLFIGWQRVGGVWPLWYQYLDGHTDPSRPISPELKGTFEEISFSFYYTILFSFFFSIALLWRQWGSITPAGRTGVIILASCILFWLLEYMLIFTDRKHRYPLEPLMIIFVARFWEQVLFDFRWEKMRLRFGKVPA